MSTKSTLSLTVAVLLTYECQLLDMSGIDLFGMMSKEYMAPPLPKPFVDLAMDVKIYYIGNDGTQDSTLRSLTAQADIKADVSTSSENVRPGAIDILLIPGPPPQWKHSEETLNFVREHSRYGTTILVVCTGCFVVAQAGILDGRKASGPRGLIPQLRKDFPKVTWDDQRRYVKDVERVGSGHHQLWSSGGICNGLEMIAAFLRDQYPGPLTEAVCAMADVGDKGEYYSTGVGVDNAWWLGQVLRALIWGQRGPKQSQNNKPS